MRLFWKIRYFDRADKQFKDRCRVLNTESLDALTRAAVELAAEEQTSSGGRGILKFRHLFEEGDLVSASREPHNFSQFRTVFLLEYFEDEAGDEITMQQIGPLLTGDPNTVLIPQGAKQHDIDFMFSEQKPIPIAGVSLDQDEIRLLGYFVRDFHEMRQSAFMKDRPGKLTSSGSVSGPSADPTLETSATDDEIRSFITIFRRLYMEKEPANFQKAVEVYVKALGDHPIAKWVAGIASEYQAHLNSVPEIRPFMPAGTCSFTTKRLIDVFLYTKYAHQPDEKREKQYAECLAQVHGKKAVLAWMFLAELWNCGLEIGNAGRQVAAWFKRYCEHHAVVPEVLYSLVEDHAGVGAIEKEADRTARLFREKVEELAMDLWKTNGRPEGGPTQFLLLAREQLRQATGNQGGKQ